MTNSINKNNSSDNIPTLRFPEYKGGWEMKRLEDLTKYISSGKSKTREENGKFPLFGSTGIIGFSNNYDYSGNKILIARVGANAGSLYKVENYYCVTDNTLILDLIETVNVDFIYYYLLKKNLNKLVFGSGQPLITGKQLKSFKVLISLLPEQQKIATFLTAVDSKIEFLQKKKSLLEQYKKGVMQQLFTSPLERGQRGVLGFKKEDGTNYPEWEEKKLGNLSHLITKGTTPTSLGFSYLTHGVNFIKAENISKSFFIDINSTPKISDECNNALKRSELKANDILFSIAGTLGRTAIVAEKDLPANTNQALSIIRLKSGVENRYINYVLNSRTIKKRISQLLSVGAQPNLSLEQVGNLKIKIPCLEEQTQIANFLSAIDVKIDNCKLEIENYSKWKKGLLQQLFV